MARRTIHDTEYDVQPADVGRVLCEAVTRHGWRCAFPPSYGVFCHKHITPEEKVLWWTEQAHEREARATLEGKD